MKIRSDFVTNSSCSSYVSVHIESRKLAEIMEKWKDKLDETQYGPVDVKDGVSFGSDDILMTNRSGQRCFSGSWTGWARSYGYIALRKQ